MLTVEEIVAGGLCIGCGLCQAIAGPETPGLRLADCARLNSVAENLLEARGALRRARAGRLGEGPAVE